VLGGADDHVGVAVAIHVTRSVDAPAQMGAQLIRLEECRRARGSSARAQAPTQEHEHRTLVGLPAIVERYPDDDVGVAVAVGVACTGDTLPELGAALVGARTRRGVGLAPAGDSSG